MRLSPGQRVIHPVASRTDGCLRGGSYGHVKPLKRRTQFLELCRYLRTLYPAHIRIAIVCDNVSPHLTTKECQRVATWAAANNVEIAYTPTNGPWLTASRPSSPPCVATSSCESATPTTGAYAPSSTGRTLPDVALASHPPLRGRQVLPQCLAGLDERVDLLVQSGDARP